MSLVSIRDPNIFNKCLHLGRCRAGELGNYYRYGKVEQHADTTYAFRRNAKPPIGLHVGFRVDEFEVDDGISHQVEGGLKLVIGYEMQEDNSCKLSARIE